MRYQLHKNRTPSVLAFFPNTRGVGYSFFEANKKHYLSEMITTRKRFDNEKYIKRMKEKINEFSPKVLVLEEYRKTESSVKTKRIRSLIKKIAEYSKKQNIDVYFYTRKHIREVFSV